VCGVRESRPEEILSVRIDADLAESLRDLASRHERTVSQELRIAVRRHLRVHARKTDKEDAA
jgi:predicted transcriptional regulator